MASRAHQLRKQRFSSPGEKARRDLKQRTTGPSFYFRSLDRNDLLIAIALAVVTFAVYAQVATHQFIGLDDDAYLRDNPMVANGLTADGFAWAFTTYLDSNWHPITWLSHMVDFQIFGSNAGGHLIMNALIHILNAVLLFVFLRQLTGARWASVMVAALFALHPLHVESVAWAIERKDTLSTLFGLLSLLAYARYAATPSPAKYLLVALCLALGLMSKPMLVTWPFVFLLMDYWPLRRFESQPVDGIKRLVKSTAPFVLEKIPLFILVAASMGATYWAQSHQVSVGRVFDAPFWLRCVNALVSYGKYIFFTFWPVDLAIYYPLSRMAPPLWQSIGAACALIGVTAVAVLMARRWPWLIVGWLWFLGTLVPVIGFVQVGIGEAMADRYHYIPSIGLFIALVFTLAKLASGWRIRPVFVGAVSLLVVLMLATLTFAQTARWRDTEILFKHTLSVTSDNLIIEYNLGRALGRQGKFKEAIPHFLESLRLKPDFFDGVANTALYYLNQGQTDEAVSYYHRALELKPDSASTHMHLAMALAQQDKKDDSLKEFYRAKELDPNNSDIRTNLGLTLARQGKLSDARAELNEALRLNPASAEAHNNLGLVYLMAGQPEEGLPHFTTAVKIKPDFKIARDNIVKAQKQIEDRNK